MRVGMDAPYINQPKEHHPTWPNPTLLGTENINTNITRALLNQTQCIQATTINLSTTMVAIAVAPLASGGSSSEVQLSQFGTTIASPR
jgi:hypothetical protein